MLADVIIDAVVMSCQLLREVYARQIDAMGSDDTLLSMHPKATLMKVSDPSMFGHTVTVCLSGVFVKHATLFDKRGVEPNNRTGARASQIYRRS